MLMQQAHRVTWKQQTARTQHHTISPENISPHALFFEDDVVVVSVWAPDPQASAELVVVTATED
jgi:hypothetical protein